MRKAVICLVAALMILMLSFSVYAATGDAYANRTEAHAWVNNGNISTQLLDVVARMGSALNWTGESYEAYTTSLSASASASNLSGPVQVSRASAYCGDACLGEEYHSYH